MSKLANQWIELFRAGSHDGKPGFTESDLDQVVKNYDPQINESPITIGHPSGSAPAFGWMGAVKRVGSLLLGKPSQVQPEFEDMVERGLFKKRSVGLVKGENGWNLHHVAFLGAQAPAVKGLKDCTFADTGDVVKFEFEESAMADETVTAISGFKTWLEGIMGSAKSGAAAAVTFSEADVTRIATEAAQAAAAAAVAPVQAKLDAKIAEFAQRDASLATVETRTRGEAAVAKLKAEGRWVPAFAVMGLPVVFAELAKVTEVVEFGEGDAKKKLTPLEVLVQFMEQLPKIVPGGEVYTGTRGSSAGASSRRFNAHPSAVDQNSVRLDQAIAEYAATNKVSYVEAAYKVADLHPELTLPGGSTVGAV